VDSHQGEGLEFAARDKDTGTVYEELTRLLTKGTTSTAMIFLMLAAELLAMWVRILH
jgi:hypothetical protein